MKAVRAYLAAPFAFQPRMRMYAQELRALGMQVTSRWLDEKVSLTTEVTELSEDYCAETAFMDIKDIAESNVFILFTPTDEELANPDISKKAWARGGRHFETGLACGMRLVNALLTGMEHTYPVILVCGPRENIFYAQEHIVRHDNWDQTVSYLLRLAHENCDHQDAASKN